MQALKQKQRKRGFAHFEKNKCINCGFTYLDFLNSQKCAPWCSQYRVTRVMRPGNTKGSQKRN